MGINIWLAYVGTVLVLMCTPGPSQLLILSNSVHNGFRRTLFTAAGDLSANFIQMVVASVGLVSLINNFREFFLFVKWAGVAYLIYQGLRLLFLKASNGLSRLANKRSVLSLYWQGFITSAVNPKAVIFFAALFPQFINPSKPLLVQFAILSSTYLTMDALFLSFYGKFAEWISKKLQRSAHQHLSRVSGTFLIIAAILLGLKDIESK